MTDVIFVPADDLDADDVSNGVLRDVQDGVPVALPVGDYGMFQRVRPSGSDTFTVTDNTAPPPVAAVIHAVDLGPIENDTLPVAINAENAADGDDVFWVLVPAGDAAPDASEIEAGQTGGGGDADFSDQFLWPDRPVVSLPDGLDEAYVMYVVINNGQVSNVGVSNAIAINTVPAPPPSGVNLNFLDLATPGVIGPVTTASVNLDLSGHTGGELLVPIGAHYVADPLSTVTSAQLNGVAAISLVSQQTPGWATTGSLAAYAVFPAGDYPDTGTLEADVSSNFNGLGAAAYELPASVVVLPLTDAGFNLGASRDVSGDVTDGDAVVGIHVCQDGGTPINWIGLAENGSADLRSGGDTFSVASANAVAAATPMAITSTMPVSSQITGLSVRISNA